MKWIKTYTRLLESNLKPRQTVFVKYEEFPGHLRKFKEVLRDKFENSVFGVLDDNDVKLKELVPIKPLDEKEPDEKWIILHYIKEEYHWEKDFEDFFLRVYVLNENKSEFEKVLAFDAEKYPTIKKWKAVEADDQYQYKEVEVRMNIFSKKEIQLQLDSDNPKKVLIYKFSNKFNRDDATSPYNKYSSGYQGSFSQSHQESESSFPDHTREVDFAENFYIDNFIRSLKKNSNIKDFIEDDGSVKPMPALFRKSFFMQGSESKRFISLKEFLEKCPEAPDAKEFSKLGYIPLNEFLKEVIGIFGYDTKDWESKIDSLPIKFIPQHSSNKMRYLYILSSLDDFQCTQEEICAFRKITVGTKENPKENLRYIIFELISKGIPQEKAEEIYNTYKDKPTEVVEPKLIFELPK